MRTPDLVGTTNAQAWHMTEVVKRNAGPVVSHATLTSYLLHVPWAHPAWSYYLLSLIHLRDLPGIPPATKKYPDAAYELIIISLDPQFTPDPDIGKFHFLEPFDVVEQFHGVTDAQVIEMGEVFVQAILAGTISPDQDYRSHWTHMVAAAVQYFQQHLAAPRP